MSKLQITNQTISNLCICNSGQKVKSLFIDEINHLTTEDAQVAFSKIINRHKNELKHTVLFHQNHEPIKS